MHAHSCLPDAYQLVTLLDNYTHGPVTRVICTSLLVQNTFVFDMSLKRLQVFGHLILRYHSLGVTQTFREKRLQTATIQDHTLRADLNTDLKEGWQDGRGRGGKPGKGAPG